MGTNTDYTGAIRITPCVEEPLATRLKQFMDIRHMKRNVKTLHTLFPDLEDRKPMSLFGDGDFGEEGAFFIPVETPDLNRRLHEAGPYPEGLDNKFSMNKPPNPCPSLYCNLVLLNDPNNGRSYLGWNEAEKSYYKVEPVGPSVDDAALAMIALRFLEGFLQKRCGVEISGSICSGLLGQKQR